MISEILKTTSPKRPAYGKGLESLKILSSQLSTGMDDTIIPTLFPLLGEYVSGAEFKHPSNTWMELCGMISHLIAESGMNKGELTVLAEALARKLREHDQAALQRISQWSKSVQTKGSNKEKPSRPDVALFFPPANCTSAALLTNAMCCEQEGGHCQYFNLPEVEQADRLCGGHRQVSEMLRNINDRVRDGALRATANGVTGNPIFRVNITLSSTPFAARRFFRGELFNGTLGRVHTFYRPRNGRSGKIPRQGSYDEAFLLKVDAIVQRLEECKGRFVIPQLNKMVDRLAAEMAELADLTDNDVLWDMGKRAIQYGFKCGCIMWILAGQNWTRGIGEWVEYIVTLDIWSKCRIYSDLLGTGDTSTEEAAKCRPRNMLDCMPDTFSESQLEVVREQMNKSRDARNQLKQWTFRGYITYSAQTGLYSKTETYLQRHPGEA